jgi:PIN domain nuclease of toxin-antitoxin system
MSEMIALDTHIWFWWINEEYHRFPASWLTRIENAEKVFVSPVSCFEIALAKQRGRLALPCDVNDWLRDALNPAGIELLPMTAEIATRAVSLSPIHKDPFDRIIIASALEHNAQLASIDGNFPLYAELQLNLMQA